MSNIDIDAERAAFEAHMRSRDETHLYRRDAPGSTRLGQYCRQSVQDQWETWQARAASPQPAVCATCKGHGMIGGPSYYAPDEGGEPCPDCTIAQPVEQTAEPVAWRWEVEVLGEKTWQYASHWSTGPKDAQPLYAAAQPVEQTWAPVISRDFLGQIVREAWVKWAKQQPNPKPSWLAQYAELSEADKEADRQIGEAVLQWVMSIKSATWEVTPTQPVEQTRALTDCAQLVTLFEVLMQQNIVTSDESYLSLKCVGVPPTEEEFVAALSRAMTAARPASGETE